MVRLVATSTLKGDAACSDIKTCDEGICNAAAHVMHDSVRA